MPNYEKLYFTLFHSFTNSIQEIENQNYGSAKEILITAQQKTEELCCNKEESAESV